MNDNDQPKRKKSIDFKLRFQALEDTHDGVLLSHLISLGSLGYKSLILHVLRVWDLPLVYKQKGNLTEEELRVMALEACNVLESRASYIRQVFCLEKPIVPFIMNGQNSISPQSQPLPTPESKPEQSQSSHKELQLGIGAVKVKDIQAVFGDDEDM
ncbi:MAG: hypothetical protein WBB28_21160 [Crinalium sp.]